MKQHRKDGPFLGSVKGILKAGPKSMVSLPFIPLSPRWPDAPGFPVGPTSPGGPESRERQISGSFRQSLSEFEVCLTLKAVRASRPGYPNGPSRSILAGRAYAKKSGSKLSLESVPFAKNVLLSTSCPHLVPQQHLWDLGSLAVPRAPSYLALIWKN